LRATTVFKHYALKNLEDKDYTFQSNNINSTSFFCLVGDYSPATSNFEILVIDVRISEEKVKELNQKLIIE
jgi:hypothetical protein